MIPALLGSLACAAEPPSPPPAPVTTAPSTPTAEPAMPILDGPASFVRYEVGNPAFRGRSTLEVHGDGRAIVTFTQASRTDTYEGKLDAGSIAALRDTLSRNDPRALVSGRTTAKPDEVRVRVVVGGPDGEVATELWSGEQWEIPSLRTLITAFNGVMATVSGGKVKY